MKVWTKQTNQEYMENSHWNHWKLRNHLCNQKGSAQILTLDFTADAQIEIVT